MVIYLKYKRIIAFICCFVIVFNIVFVSASATGVGVSGVFSHVLSTLSDWFVSASVDGIILNWAPIREASDKVTNDICSNSPTRHHDFTFKASAFSPNIRTETCRYCNVTWSSFFLEAEDSFTSSLDSTTATNSGFPVYNGGFELTGTFTDEERSAYWKSIPLYSLANAASPDTFMFLGAYSSYGSGFVGLKLLVDSTTGYSYISCGMHSCSRYDPCNVDETLPTDLSSAVFPLGVFVPYSNFQGVYGTTSRRVYLNLADAYNYWYQTDMDCYFLTPESYLSGLTYKSDFGTGYVCVYNCGYVSADGTVSYSNMASLDITGHQTYGCWFTYAYPRYYHAPASESATTRPTSIFQTINNYNNQFSIGENPTNINYYINPTGQDVTPENLCPPAVYDEESLVYTDPVTGMEYLTTGWTYDYLTRCYTLSMGDTFLIGDTVIDTIKLTYGDEKLTVDHYASGVLVQSDTYDYVIVSGSECSLNGHSYTYETIKQETCTSVGERKYTCSVCGDEYAETVPASEHPFTYTEAKPPTCTSSGMGIYTCPDCGLQSTETIPKTGHRSVVVEVVPNEYDENGALISVGYTLYECSVCGTQYTEAEDVGVEDEGWFSWIGGLFKKLISAIVNGLASGLEWIVNEVLLPVVSWIVEATKWVFGLFNGEHLSALFNWFNFDHEAWLNEFSDPALFKEVA